jgi:hypothetical protein
VGEVATEDTGVEVDQIEATGRSGSSRRLLYSDGGWSWSCQRAAWGRGKARGMAGGAGSTVRCSHGWGGRRQLYFGDFLRRRLGGW